MPTGLMNCALSSTVHSPRGAGTGSGATLLNCRSSPPVITSAATRAIPRGQARDRLTAPRTIACGDSSKRNRARQAAHNTLSAGASTSREHRTHVVLISRGIQVPEETERITVAAGPRAGLE